MPPKILFKEVVWLLGGNTVSAESLNRDILAHSPSRDPLPLLAHKAVLDASEGPWQCDFNPYLSTTSPTPSLVALSARPSLTAQAFLKPMAKKSRFLNVVAGAPKL